MKRIVFLLAGFAAQSFAQSSPNAEELNKAIENRLERITVQVASEYDLRREAGFYIPSFSAAVRFNGENLLNGPGVFLVGFYADFRFMRFTRGFALLRVLVEAPIGKYDFLSKSGMDVSILTSSCIVSGGFGGGFSFLDTRLGKSGIGHVATVTFLATVGSRFGVPYSARDAFRLFGGLEVGFRYQYYFFRYASFQIGFDIGLRFGVSSTVTYGFAVGMAF